MGRKVIDPKLFARIDRARARADRAALSAMRGGFHERKPFKWTRPKLTPEQVKKAATLQERSVLNRFVDTSFNPENEKGDLLLASFKVTPPKGESLEEAANHVTLESSTGTWTDVQTETSYTLGLAGTVYHMEPEVEGRAGHVKVAYPIALFEPGSISQLLSCIGGNIMAMKAVDRIKLMDFSMPRSYLRTFPGPRFGVAGIRRVSNVRGHTLVGTIVKPKTGLFPDEYAEALYNTFRYCCVVKDDENLSDQSFNPFHLRALLCYRKIRQIERENAKKGIHEKKIYLPNVTTTDTVESLARAYYVHDLGARSAMVDIITTGFSTVQALRNFGPPIIWHGHRAMHASFARVPDHGIDMMAIAKCSRMAGIDELHIGTVVGKMEGEAHEILNYVDALRQDRYVPGNYGDGKDEPYQWFLPQDWYGMKPVMPVNSGGLYPKHLIRLKELFGTDTVTTMGGGIHSYGTVDGAWVARLAAEAAAKGYDLPAVREDYHNICKKIKFDYVKPEEEAFPLLDRVIGGKDWKAMAFSKNK